ncbi:hypothetical protein K9L16_02085 [Candidatus Pacearchaeota archaeon]|nr:hypothetical protein [Candidatus Pacearchaeota archaeon]
MPELCPEILNPLKHKETLKRYGSQGRKFNRLIKLCNLSFFEHKRVLSILEQNGVDYAVKILENKIARSYLIPE